MPSLPYFNDGKDEIDNYLNRFERFALIHKWPKEDWSLHLSSLLQGKALNVYSSLSFEDAQDYDILKHALLDRYNLTVDGFRHKFKSSRPEGVENFSQLAHRISSHFHKWLSMFNIESSVEALTDFVIKDQFISCCNNDLQLFIREHDFSDLNGTVKIAEQYRESRRTSASHLSRKIKFGDQMKKAASGPKVDQADSVKRRQPHPNQGKQFLNKPVSEKRCFKCNKTGHFANQCNHVQSEVQSVAGNVLSPNNDTIIDVISKISCKPVVVNSHSFHSKFTENRMPVFDGRIFSKPCQVLRDTGCSGIVVKSDLVPEDALLDEYTTCSMADGSEVKARYAYINIDSPVLKGMYKAWCFPNPLYDLIVGNVDGARGPFNPDVNWSPEEVMQAVKTRAQVKNEKNPYSKLKVPELIGNINPEDVKNHQLADTSLDGIRKMMDGASSKISKDPKVTWVSKNGLLFRYFVNNHDTYFQLIVPKFYRFDIMRLVHEGILAGHMGIKRTLNRILSEFYWPGIVSDVKKFCQSCDICQRTIKKGAVMKAPLQQLPIIDEPMKRVAIDIVGPISPPTERKNRFILTLIDYATRYPEAVALPSIETERVAEALLNIFSRVGIPKEMLTDLGSNFVSDLMKEVCRLLSIKKLTTTPYHAMCNGLVERFNGTLKLMLKRLCQDKPKSWDKYLNPVLFAYREIPQESLGFSPFELMYGRPVRGPMVILKELMVNQPDNEVKNTYQYVCDLKERLETTAELARENLMKARKKQMSYYNKGAKERKLKVGDKVLILLPTDSNKLLMHWKGPYTIL